jgi:hypothetical protein
MESLTADQFAAAVHAAITGVRHLYRELSLLNMALVEALATEPDPLVRLLPTGKGTGKAAAVVRDWHGQLFRPAEEVDEDEEALEDDLDDAEDTEEEAVSAKRSTKILTFEPDQPLLALKLTVYEAGRGAQFQPELLYAVLNDWTIGKPGRKIDNAFQVKRYMLKRVPKAIELGVDRKPIVSGAKIAGKGGKRVDRRLGFTVSGSVQSKRLFELSGPDSVAQLATEIKDHWKRQTDR